MSDSLRVVLVGFMGAGKTSAGRALARLAGCDFIDLDELVAAREGRTPQRLIDEDGEAAFRERETEALRAALAGDGARVVAAGGGAWALGHNRDLVVAEGFLSVWLDAPFELCWRRVESEGATRPLARDRLRARALYDERRAAYALADLRAEAAEGRTPEELAAEVAAALAGDGRDVRRKSLRPRPAGG
jgi:shikimate kinase